MKQSHLLYAAAIAVLVTACADDTIAPTQMARPQMSAVSAPRHVVAFKSGVPSDIDAAVSALGGSIDLRLNKLGGAVISGLSAEGAAALAARADVLGVGEEGAIEYGDQSTEAQPVMVNDATSSIAAPNTAVLYSWQWNLRAVNANTAWSQGRLGSSAVTAAILDTGIDYTLPDLNGRVDLTRSTSFVPADDALMAIVFPTIHKSGDMEGHGTNVATQTASNAAHFAGVTSQTTLISVKVCGFVPGNCPGGAVLAGIEYAVDAGAAVINMSLGGGFLKNANGALVALYNRAFQYAEQNGVTVVVSAGNSEINLDAVANAHITYCDQVHVICVAAAGPKDTGPSQNGAGPFADQDDPAFYTNFGRSRIDVSAPGGNYVLNSAGTAVATAGWIYSICSQQRLAKLPGGGLAYTSCSAPGHTSYFIVGYAGTSQAAPHVTGLAALLASEVGKSPALIRTKIAKGADDVGVRGVDPYSGSGRINVGNTK